MSTRHNTKHPERGRKRPRKFGTLEDPDVLRKRQEKRVEEYGDPWPREREQDQDQDQETAA